MSNQNNDFLHGCIEDRYRPPKHSAVHTERRAPCIDVHCHLISGEVEHLVAETPEKRAERSLLEKVQGADSVAQNERLGAAVYDRKGSVIDERLADMDAMGVDLQAISVSPVQYYYWAEPDLGREIAQIQNSRIAEAVADHPDRLVGLASVPLQHVGLATEMLEHAVRELGFKGVQVSSLINGLDVSDERFARFWAKAEELGALVFLHPLGTSLGARLSDHYLCNIVGQPVETAIALSKMIFAGLFDRHPSLKLCAAHGGGYLPAYIGRSDHGWSVRPESCGCRHKPSTYLDRIWFDTVVYDPEQLKHLIETVGAERIVVGSDYPYDMGHYDPHGLIGAIESLSDQERHMILWRNAAQMLNIDISTFPHACGHSDYQ